MSKYKVGLALSGGGLRGSAHIGVIDVLVKNNIPIDFIAGTSAGAIVASLYAIGYTPDQMKEIIRSIKVQDLIDIKITVADLFKHGIRWLLSGKFRFWSVLPCGLLKGDKIDRFLNKYWRNMTVRDTNIPIAITAVDINTGDTIFFTTPVKDARFILNAKYFHNTLLEDAVRASISIPGIFYPKRYRSMTLVDGGVKDNVPTDILRLMGAEKIIAVDLGYAGDPNYNIKSVGEILLQSLEIMGREITILKGEKYADIMIRPDSGGFRYDDERQFLEYIERGKQATEAQLAEIKRTVFS